MLLKNFWAYFVAIFVEGLGSGAGMLGLALVIFALVLVFAPVARDARFRGLGIQALVIAGLALLTVAFYGAEYTFDEQPGSLAFENLPEGEPTCGTAETPWTKAAYGIGNPCEWGCYRGLVITKKMRLSGFPPWPEYKRELQCWSRDGGSPFVN